jgi:hypothetical protein
VEEDQKSTNSKKSLTETQASDEELKPNPGKSLLESQPFLESETPDIPSTSNKVSKKLILIGLVFLIIVLIISGLYFYFQSQKQSPGNQETNQSGQEKPSPIPDPASDWKTYRNESIGFEFKYPNNWEVYSQNTSYFDEIVLWLTVDSDPKQPQDPSFSNTLEFPWADWIRVDPEGLNIFVSQKPNVELSRSGYNCDFDTEGCFFLFKYEQTDFQGIASRITSPMWSKGLADPEFSKSVGDGSKIIPHSYFSFEKNSLFWTISYTHSDFEGNYNPIYDQILSTFEFIE